MVESALAATAPRGASTIRPMPAPRTRRAGAPARGAARFAVVVSRYNSSVTDRLLEGAVLACVERTGREPDVFDAPGSFELPVIALQAARSGRFEGVVALGCLLKGETSHDRHIASAVAQGLVGVSLATGVPATFGVLTVDTPEQALARAGGARGNKGSEAMHAAIDAALAVRAARAGRGGRTGAGRAPDKFAGAAR